MNIKVILAKVAKGEDLSTEEKTALDAYDPDAIAAAARKKAEEAATTATEAATVIQAKLDEATAALEEAANKGKPELEQLRGQLDKLAKDLQAKDTEATALKDQITAGERTTALNTVISKAGISFVDGVDRDLMHGALHNVLGTLNDEQLQDDATVGTLVESFKAANKAVIADTSGTGSGAPPNDGSGGLQSGAKKISGQSLIELAQNAETSEQIAAVEKTLAEVEQANAAGTVEVTE